MYEMGVSMLQICDRHHKGIWVLWGQDLVQCHLPENEDMMGIYCGLHWTPLVCEAS